MNRPAPKQPRVGKGFGRAAALIVSAVALVGLVSWYVFSRHTAGVAPLADELTYPGFQTFPTPRTLDGPGTVFRIDRAGRRFPVTKLPAAIESGREAFASYTTITNWSLSALVKFLKGQTGEVADVATSSVKVEVLLGRGIRETTFDTDVDQLLKLATIDFRADNKYYIIRETIAVPTITFDFSNSNAFTGHAKEILTKAVQGDQRFLWGGNSASNLVEKFDEPYRIFFNADELLAPGLGTNESKPHRGPVTYKINWREEGG